MPHAIEVLELSAPLKSRLFDSGFRYIADLTDSTPHSLSIELNVTHDIALHILKTARQFLQTSPPHSQKTGHSALEMLQIQQPSILTMCEDIDRMLGGGIPTGQITEICGVPGIGKTQYLEHKAHLTLRFCIQLCCNVQIPEEFHGIAGSALYIDTEGSFMSSRAKQIAAGLVRHLTRMSPNLNSQLTVCGILNNIFYHRIHTFVEQLAVVKSLTHILQTHTNIRLIVMDSVAFHFRHNFTDMSKRTRLLAEMSQELTRVARQNNLAVVLVNQVTVNSANSGVERFNPALGMSWAHACNNRVMLSWERVSPGPVEVEEGEGMSKEALGWQRVATLVKSAAKPKKSVFYTVTASGIRGARPAKRKFTNV